MVKISSLDAAYLPSNETPVVDLPRRKSRSSSSPKEVVSKDEEDVRLVRPSVHARLVDGYFSVLVENARRYPGQAAAEDESGRVISYAQLCAACCKLEPLLAEKIVSPKNPVATKIPRGLEWYVVVLTLVKMRVPLVAMCAGELAAETEAARNKAIQEALDPQLIIDETLLANLCRGVGGIEGLLWGGVHHLDCRVGGVMDVDVSAVSYMDLITSGEDESDSGLSSGDTTCSSAGPTTRRTTSAAQRWCNSAKNEDPYRPVLYCWTGGSTGAAKIVPVHTGMMLHEASLYKRLLPENINARVLQQASVYWAANTFGTLSLVIALAGCAVFQRDSWAGSSQFLEEIVFQKKIAVFGIVPSLMADVASPAHIPSCVRTIISWGERCPAIVRDRFMQQANFRFLDLLLSTEFWLAFVCDTPDAVFRPLCEEEVPFKIVPEGIIDCAARTTPGGVVPEDTTSISGEAGNIGELALLRDSPLVFRGYKWVSKASPSPAIWSVCDGQDVYRTKDLVRRVGQNGFVFLGRADGLTKVGGKWLDLRQLEEETHAMILGTEEERYRVFLCEGADLWEKVARVNAVLPSDAVQLRILKDFPRVAGTRKVDRRALEKMEVDCFSGLLGRISGEEDAVWQRERRRLLNSYRLLTLFFAKDFDRNFLGRKAERQAPSAEHQRSCRRAERRPLDAAVEESRSSKVRRISPDADDVSSHTPTTNSNRMDVVLPTSTPRSAPSSGPLAPPVCPPIPPRPKNLRWRFQMLPYLWLGYYDLSSKLHREYYQTLDRNAAALQAVLHKWESDSRPIPAGFFDAQTTKKLLERGAPAQPSTIHFLAFVLLCKSDVVLACLAANGFSNLYTWSPETAEKFRSIWLLMWPSVVNADAGYAQQRQDHLARTLRKLRQGRWQPDGGGHAESSPEQELKSTAKVPKGLRGFDGAFVVDAKIRSEGAREERVGGASLGQDQSSRCCSVRRNSCSGRRSGEGDEIHPRVAGVLHDCLGWESLLAGGDSLDCVDSFKAVQIAAKLQLAPLKVRACATVLDLHQIFLESLVAKNRLSNDDGTHLNKEKLEQMILDFKREFAASSSTSPVSPSPHGCSTRHRLPTPLREDDVLQALFPESKRYYPKLSTANMPFFSLGWNNFVGWSFRIEESEGEPFEKYAFEKAVLEMTRRCPALRCCPHNGHRDHTVWAKQALGCLQSLLSSDDIAGRSPLHRTSSFRQVLELCARKQMLEFWQCCGQAWQPKWIPVKEWNGGRGGSWAEAGQYSVMEWCRHVESGGHSDLCQPFEVHYFSAATRVTKPGSMERALFLQPRLDPSLAARVVLERAAGVGEVMCEVECEVEPKTEAEVMKTMAVGEGESEKARGEGQSPCVAGEGGNSGQVSVVVGGNASGSGAMVPPTDDDELMQTARSEMSSTEPPVLLEKFVFLRVAHAYADAGCLPGIMELLNRLYAEEVIKLRRWRAKQETAKVVDQVVAEDNTQFRIGAQSSAPDDGEHTGPAGAVCRTSSPAEQVTEVETTTSENGGPPGNEKTDERDGGLKIPCCDKRARRSSSDVSTVTQGVKVRAFPEEEDLVPDSGTRSSSSGKAQRPRKKRPKVVDRRKMTNRGLAAGPRLQGMLDGRGPVGDLLSSPDLLSSSGGASPSPPGKNSIESAVRGDIPGPHSETFFSPLKITQQQVIGTPPQEAVRVGVSTEEPAQPAAVADVKGDSLAFPDADVQICHTSTAHKELLHPTETEITRAGTEDLSDGLPGAGTSSPTSPDDAKSSSVCSSDSEEEGHHWLKKYDADWQRRKPLKTVQQIEDVFESGPLYQADRLIRSIMRPLSQLPDGVSCAEYVVHQKHRRGHTARIFFDAATMQLARACARKQSCPLDVFIIAWSSLALGQLLKWARVPITIISGLRDGLPSNIVGLFVDWRNVDVLTHHTPSSDAPGHAHAALVSPLHALWHLKREVRQRTWRTPSSMMEANRIMFNVMSQGQNDNNDKFVLHKDEIAPNSYGRHVRPGNVMINEIGDHGALVGVFFLADLVTSGIPDWEVLLVQNLRRILEEEFAKGL